MLNNFLTKHIINTKFYQLPLDILLFWINKFYKKRSGQLFKSFSVFFWCVIFFVILNISKSYSANSSAYNGTRHTSGGPYCNDILLDEEQSQNSYTMPQPCYISRYDENNYQCDVGSIDSNPFFSNDLDWNYGNESCLAYMLATGIALQAIFMTGRSICSPEGPPAAGEALKKNLVDGKRLYAIKKNAKTFAKTAGSGSAPLVSLMTASPIDPMMVLELAWWTGKCAAQLYQCCAPAAVATVSYGIAIGALFAIWDVANKSFQSTRICGDGYKVFEKDSNNIYVLSNSAYANCLKNIFKKSSDSTTDFSASKYSNLSSSLVPFFRLKSFLSKTSNAPNSTCSNGNEIYDYNAKLTEIYYREFLFSGIEYEDSGGGACDNPAWTKEESEEILGYHLGKQRYYFRGPAQKPNFACERFLSKGYKDDEGFKAFNCCNKRSQNVICLEKRWRNPQSSSSSSASHISYDRGGSSESSSSSSSSSDFDRYFNYKFCTIGSDCVFNNLDDIIVKYDIFESQNDPNYICAKTYSVCPYDHNMAGGTDIPEYYVNRPSIVTNFCQYMRHCIKRPPISKPNFYDPSTFFLADSCRDVVGDSQLLFKVSNLKFSPADSRNLSAPIVQCLKESLENNFFQRAGQNKCSLEIEKYDDKLKKCVNQNTKEQSDPIFKKGDIMGDSIFSKIQKNFRYPIKIALVLSVVMFGYQILMAVPEVFLNKKTIMVYLIKFGLVSFFVLGNAWQGFFVDSIMKISTDLSDLTFRPMTTSRINTQNSSQFINDGCVFPKYNYLNLNRAKTEDYKPELLKTDTSSPASYPPGKNYLRIFDTLDCKLSRAIGYGPESSVSNLFKMIFAGFISGPLGIMIFMAGFAYAFLLFSIVIRAVQILIMSILAIILLIYISPLTITCVLFERTKSIFENWWKQLLGFILQPMILFAYLGLLFTVFDNAFIGDARFSQVASNSNFNYPSLDCSDYQIGGTLIKPSETSLYCIVNFPSFKSYTGLEVFDLALPVLTGLNKTKINTVLKSAILMFVFFHFLDKITTVAKKLVGGAELKADFDPNISKQIQSVLKGAQKRALNSTARLATKQIPRGAAAVARSFASKEASSKADDIKKDDNKSGGDSAGGAAGSGGDSGSASAAQDSAGSQDSKPSEGGDSGKTGSV